MYRYSFYFGTRSNLSSFYRIWNVVKIDIVYINLLLNVMVSRAIVFFFFFLLICKRSVKLNISLKSGLFNRSLYQLKNNNHRYYSKLSINDT